MTAVATDSSRRSRSYGFIADGADTVEAAILRGREHDVRTYEDAHAVLSAVIGDRPTRMLTNNPIKLAGLRDAGVRILERVALETAPTAGNRAYLTVKKLRMGHLLSQV